MLLNIILKRVSKIIILNTRFKKLKKCEDFLVKKFCQKFFMLNKIEC
jgi:hypothetical protein